MPYSVKSALLASGAPMRFVGPDQEQMLMWAIESIDLFQRYDACNGVWQ